MRIFYRLLGGGLIASTTNNFVWFALTYWVYLETNSVASTGIVAGIYLVALALSGFWFGSIVDHNPKKRAMLASSSATLALFCLGFVLYTIVPSDSFDSVASPLLWVFVVTLLCGAISGGIYNIAIPTLVTVLVPEDRRDRANGLFGTMTGVAFAITAVGSGLVLGFGGIEWVLATAIAGTLAAILYLALLPLPEAEAAPSEAPRKSEGMDIRGTIKVIDGIPGLFPLIFFTTLNNFLAGVFFALLDAYGLSLVSVQVWGLLFGFLSLGFISGGLFIARYGLGTQPLRTLFRVNIVIWTASIFMAIQASIVLLAVGLLIWTTLVPFIEATEQTIIQAVVPPERQGRVFGFAHSVEQAASPLTAFLIGPIAQFIFVPFMTTGEGADLIGDWFGTGTGRGIALVFMLAGTIGLVVTLLAMRSPSYKLLSARYQQP